MDLCGGCWAPHLPTEGDCTGLALGANASRPGRVVRTALTYLAAKVLQVQELPTVHSAGHLAQVAVERHVFDGRGKEPGVPGVQWGAIDTLPLRSMVTPRANTHHRVGAPPLKLTAVGLSVLFSCHLEQPRQCPLHLLQFSP